MMTYDEINKVTPVELFTITIRRSVYAQVFHSNGSKLYKFYNYTKLFRSVTQRTNKNKLLVHNGSQVRT